MNRALHFDRHAATYEGARPPYPDALYRELESCGVIGPGRRVLEVGAGTGEATTRLVAGGSAVTAVEPGERLAQRLRARLPEVEVRCCRLEDADVTRDVFDSVVAATSLHWVDLAVALPRLRAALKPGGRLAVWRTRYGSDDDTPFRRIVTAVVARRGAAPRSVAESRPTMAELAAGGHFSPVTTREWAWDIDLTPEQIRRLFTTFSDWTAAEVDEVATAAAGLGPTVRERYTTRLHVLARQDDDVAY